MVYLFVNVLIKSLIDIKVSTNAFVVDPCIGFLEIDEEIVEVDDTTLFKVSDCANELETLVSDEKCSTLILLTTYVLRRLFRITPILSKQSISL